MWCNGNLFILFVLGLGSADFIGVTDHSFNELQGADKIEAPSGVPPAGSDDLLFVQLPPDATAHWESTGLTLDVSSSPDFTRGATFAVIHDGQHLCFEEHGATDSGIPVVFYSHPVCDGITECVDFEEDAHATFVGLCNSCHVDVDEHTGSSIVHLDCGGDASVERSDEFQGFGFITDRLISQAQQLAMGVSGVFNRGYWRVIGEDGSTDFLDKSEGQQTAPVDGSSTSTTSTQMMDESSTLSESSTEPNPLNVVAGGLETSAQTEIAQTEIAQSEIAQTEIAQSEIAQTEIVQSEIAQSEIAQSEIAQSEIVTSETETTPEIAILETETATEIPSETETATELAILETETATEIPSETETAPETAILETETATEIPSETETATEIPSETETAPETAILETETATEIPFETETATEIPSETETATEIPSETATEIPSETATEIPSETAAETAIVETESATEIPSETSTGATTELLSETETSAEILSTPSETTQTEIMISETEPSTQ